jgi:hypothetical protein
MTIKEEVITGWKTIYTAVSSSRKFLSVDNRQLVLLFLLSARGSNRPYTDSLGQYKTR